MAAVRRPSANGDVSGGLTAASRFSDVPIAVDVPMADSGEAVEVHLAEHLDDPTELCQLLENEKASKNLWITIALAYAKQSQIDHALGILNNGLQALASKDRLNLLSGVAWLQLLKSRQALRIKPSSNPAADAKLKDDYLKEVMVTVNEAGRINPAFQPIRLINGVLLVLRASLASALRPSADNERANFLKDALKNFEDALRASDNQNMMAMLGKARVLYMQGRFGPALDAYQRVLARMPSMTDPDPRIGIGCCLWHLGLHERASLAWTRALELDPDSKVAHALLGVYYLRESNKFSAGSASFDKLYKKAMSDHINKAYKIDKTFPMSCAIFASYFLLTNRLDAVDPLARTAIEKTDVNSIASDGWFLLGRKEHNLGELDKAHDFYGRADAARGGPGINKGYNAAKFGQLQVAIQRGQDFETSKHMLESLAGPKNTEATTLLGILTADTYFQLQKTLPTYASEGSKEAKDKQYAHILWTAAVKHLETVRKSWGVTKPESGPSLNAKKDETVLIYLAKLYEQEDPAKSVYCLDEVEELQIERVPPEEMPIKQEKLETEQNGTEKKDEQVQDYQGEIRACLPPALINNRACHFYAAGNFEEARYLFQLALNACEKLSQKQKSDRDMAAEGNMHEDDVDNTDVDALLTTISYNLGRTVEALGLPEEAVIVYETLLDRHGDYTEAKARLAFIKLNQFPKDEGPKAMAQLYNEESGNIDVRALMGWYYHSSKKKTNNVAEDAEYRQYRHTLQNHDKHDVYSLTGMGNVHLTIAREMPRNNDAEKEKRAKMYSKAYEFFDKVLQLDPKNAYAAQGIAIMLCDDKKNFSEALQILARVKDTVQDVSVLTNLGHVYTELRQYPKAIENYRRALQIDDARHPGHPSNPQLLACLSRAQLLKAKAERSIIEHNESLQKMEAALAANPDQLHLRFNVAFIQFQVAQNVNATKELDRTLADVEAAIEGLDEAIATLEDVAQSKNPPYPRSALEQRAAMGRNTIKKQLERARTAQAEYERNNTTKLAEATKRREAEMARREAAEEALRREAQAKREALEAERQKMIAESERRNEQARAEAAAREALEYTDDEATGDRIKRKDKAKKERAAKGGGRKRKARDENDFIEDDEEEGRSERSVSRTPATGSDDDGVLDDDKPAREDRPKKKRRRLERKGGAATKKAPSKKAATNSKFKSDERVVDSDEDDEPIVATPPSEEGDEDMKDAPNGAGADDGDEEGGGEDSDVVAPSKPKQRKKPRLIADDDDEDEDGEGDGGNAELAQAAMAAVDGDDDD